MSSYSDILDEDAITKALAAFLEDNGWKILSINSPFAGRSVMIRPTGARRSKGALIPAIIASKDRSLMIVESSSPYKASDEKKLRKYRTKAFFVPIGRLFRLRSVSELQLAMAVPLVQVSKVHDSKLISFGVDNNGTVRSTGSNADS